jgi:hypothetical protein
MERHQDAPRQSVEFFDIKRASSANDQSGVIVEAFKDAIRRLEKILDIEIDLLKRNRPIVLHDFNHQKNRGLLELSRIISSMRGMELAPLNVEAQAALTQLRLKLKENLALLETHLQAVAAISAIISQAIQDHESDGTYSVGVSCRERAV